MQLIAWCIPGFILLILLEAWVARRRGLHVYRLPIALSDMGCGITSQLFNLLTFSISIFTYAAVYAWRGWDLDPSSGWTWLLAMIGVDFAYYWWHRASHEVNILWAAHVVHHQSEDYNLAVALRQAFLTNITMIPFLLPLALLGVPPLVFAAAKGLNAVYQFWIHTELIRDIGPLERVLNTPSHHRVHHAINPQYLDRNYAGILITWDRLFGSFERERERPVYGITKPLRSLNPLWANFHYYVDIAAVAAAATRWQDRLYAVVAHPGWRPGREHAPPLGPGELSDRAAHPYEVGASGGLRLYVLAQAVLGVPLTMYLLIAGHGFTPGALLLAVALVGLSTVTWAGLFERKAWAWPVEVLRVGLGTALLIALRA